MSYTYDVYDRRITKTIDLDGTGPATATEEHFVYVDEQSEASRRVGDHIALVFDENGTHPARRVDRRRV